MTGVLDNSILDSTKDTLGLAADYTPFDAALITHINSAFSDLTDIGIGPSEGFIIEDNTAVWSDFIGDNLRYVGGVTNFIWLKTRTYFDPPEGRYAIQATDGQLSQMLWRLSVIRENVEWVPANPVIEEDTILFGGGA